MSLPILFPCLQFMKLSKDTCLLVLVQILGEVMNETVRLCPTLCAYLIYNKSILLHKLGHNKEAGNDSTVHTILLSLRQGQPVVVQILGELMKKQVGCAPPYVLIFRTHSRSLRCCTVHRI